MTDRDRADIGSLTHYLRSALASIKTISETLALNKTSNQAKLLESLKDSVERLDYRISLYTNLLHFKQDLNQPSLEYFDLRTILEEKSPGEIFINSSLNTEILSDRGLVKLLIDYTLDIARLKSKNNKITVTLTTKGNTYGLLVSSKLGIKKFQAAKTDQQFEENLLVKTSSFLAGKLKGSLIEKKIGDQYQLMLKLPQKFSP